MQIILIWVAAAVAGFFFVRAVLRNAVKQNDFTVVLILIIGAVAAIVSL